MSPTGEETGGQGGEQRFPASGSGFERAHLGVLSQQEQVPGEVIHPEGK